MIIPLTIVGRNNLTAFAYTHTDGVGIRLKADSKRSDFWDEVLITPRELRQLADECDRLAANAITDDEITDAAAIPHNDV